MCLAIPTRIVSIDGEMAVAEVGGVERDISIMMTPGVKRGDYVIVHAGFAIQKLDQAEAEENLRILEQMARAVETERARHRRARSERPG
ncbi:HypC/HybG/HupF family hydrogenase formation chaperone [candidate division WOR-3 bacterium]|nr:HypC/HybG/HupF family hydrogenase formation chaperone [candidate division WOR-3 bacterium]